jgi:ATPase subunit of ABC transporter with duplicated ATPase domains
MIALRNLGVLHPDPLFRDLSLVLGKGDRLGLVAGNGAGKTTLLRIVAGTAEATHGDVTRPRGLRLGHVEQDLPPGLRELTLAEAVRRAIPAADREAQEWRVDVVLEEFGADAALLDRPVRALSGGWQRLALIARAWVREPDALLLDEPTNHLDLAKILMLEAWVRAQTGLPIIIASHDRRFLDACTNRTLFLRRDISRLYDHPYVAARHLLAEDDRAHEAKLAKDAREVDRLRRSAGELRNIGINSGSDDALKKSKHIRQRADALENTMVPAHVERTGDIRLGNRGTHAKVLFSFAGLTVTAPDATKLFTIGKLDVFQGDRIVLLGRNGAGKSQFVGLVRRALDARDTTPGVRVSPSVAVGYVDQHMSHLPAGDTPQGFINGVFRLGDQRSISLLASAGFALAAQRLPIDRLSPGQKARLGLLALRLAEPNFYLMDEPTNHVDIAGQEQLEQEIITHQATCLLVSHDRSFVDAIGTRFLLIDGGRVYEIDGPAMFNGMLATGARLPRMLVPI